MSNSSKIILGIISLLPIIFIAAYFIWFISFFADMMNTAGHRQNNPDSMPPYFIKNILWMMMLVGLSMLISVGLMIYYIIHVVNNKSIDSNERIVWILVFIFINIIGYPVYWYMRIWKDNKQTLPLTVSANAGNEVDH